MRIVIVGAGVVGYNAAALLSREQHDIVLIEKDENTAAAASEQLDVMTVQGSGTNADVLRRAGVGEADLFIAATAVDEVNIVACFLAKQMGARRTVARIREPSVLSPLIVDSAREHKRVVRPKTMGIDFTITPEQVTAEEVARVMRRTCAIAVEEFGEGRIELAELQLGSAFGEGRPLREITFPRPCIVAAIVRGNTTIIPHGDDRLREGDHVYIIAERASMGDLVGAFGVCESVLRDAVIMGAGRIGLRTARTLRSMGIKVKIIEKSLERSRDAAAQLDDVLVIHGEGTDSNFLREEGVAEADGFVAATGRDELNVMVGLLAKKLGAKHVVVIVNKPEYTSLIRELGIDAAVNPLTMTANAILRFVRRGRVISVALLEGEAAEAIELEIGERYKHTGVPLRKVSLPKNLIVGAVMRGDKVIIPNGDTTLEVGDRIVLVCSSDAVATVERYFGST